MSLNITDVMMTAHLLVQIRLRRPVDKNTASSHNYGDAARKQTSLQIDETCDVETISQLNISFTELVFFDESCLYSAVVT